MDTGTTTISVESGYPAPANSTGIKVIVVGLGLAGMTAAIECHRKGHSVIALEKILELERTGGDCIGIGSNAARIIAKWGDGSVHGRLLPNLCTATKGSAFDTSGRFIFDNSFNGYQVGEGYTLSREALMATLYDYARSLGIDMRLGCQVTEYWETDDEAGVVVNGGTKIAADCLVCGDGVHSTGRAAISGDSIITHGTDYATFRALFGSEEVARDPQTRWILEGTESGEDQLRAFIGDGVHLFLWTMARGREVLWMCIHKDSYHAQETWTKQASASIDNVVECIRDWPIRHKIEPLIRKTPRDSVIDHKLVLRPPLDTWVSPRRRMIVIGDAAHAYFPAIGQGGGQAIEDGAVLAIALQMAGKGNEALALRVTEKIRYSRATAMQIGSSVLTETSFKVDLDLVAKDPRFLTYPYHSWIFDHDCQEYTYREFAKVAEAIQNGKEYIPHNVPADGIYRLSHESDAGKMNIV